jgi:hypothetical protein
MVLNTQATTFLVRSMASVNFLGLMVALMRDTSMRIYSRERVLIDGLTVEYILENGKLTKWMALANSNGQMAEYT